MSVNAGDTHATPARDTPARTPASAAHPRPHGPRPRVGLSWSLSKIACGNAIWDDATGLGAGCQAFVRPFPIDPPERIKSEKRNDPPKITAAMMRYSMPRRYTSIARRSTEADRVLQLTPNRSAYYYLTHFFHVRFLSASPKKTTLSRRGF